MSDETNTVNTKTNDQAIKMQSLREMISNAEKTIQGAKAMLLQLEGKKKVGRHRKIEDDDEGTVIQGTFDGQIMLGSDGKQYPVPANYASKSKLVEGDLLKLHITPEGSFIYKQIGPIERKHALGIVTQDEGGNYIVIADDKPYRILLASITYFKAQPGDEAAIVTSRDIDSHWASLENIVQKAKYDPGDLSFLGSLQTSKLKTEKKKESRKKAEIKEDDLKTAPEEEAENETNSTTASEDLLEEWRADIEAIEKEIAESEKKKENIE